LGEKRARLDERKRDLELCTVALVNAQAQGISPQDNHEELMEFVEHRWLLQDVEADCVTEAGRLGEGGVLSSGESRPASNSWESNGIRVRPVTSLGQWT
jgi:hypothetical protein